MEHLAAEPEEIPQSLQKLNPNSPEKPGNYQPDPEITVLPDLPDELKSLLSLGNRDLTMQHWGLVLGLWLLQNEFPLHTSVVRDSLNLSRKQFWALTDKLVERHIIWLRWGRTYKWFQAFFTPAKIAGVTSTPAKIAGVTTGAKIAGVTPHPGKNRRSKPHTGTFPLGGGGVYIKSTTTTPTPEETRLALAGDPGACLARWIPAFQFGMVIPHFQEAAVLDPQNAVARLRGAVFTLDDRFRRGLAPKNPLAALMSYVQKNHVLDEKSTYGDKPASVKTAAPTPDAETEREHRDLLNKMADLTLEEAKAEVSAHPFFRTNKKTLLQNYIALLKKNPCQDEFRAWAEKELAS